MPVLEKRTYKNIIVISNISLHYMCILHKPTTVQCTGQAGHGRGQLLLHKLFNYQTGYGITILRIWNHYLVDMESLSDRIWNHYSPDMESLFCGCSFLSLTVHCDLLLLRSLRMGSFPPPLLILYTSLTTHREPTGSLTIPVLL